MRVLKRNGKEEVFNDKKIHKRVERACKGIDHVDPKTIVYNSTLKLYDGVRTEEIDQALIKSSRALIEQQPEYSSVAAAILLNSLYKEVFGESVDSDAVQYQYRKAFVTNIKKLVKEGVLAKDLLKFDLKQLAEHIDIKRDELFEYAGLQTVVDRYLIKSNNSIVESPQAWWMRIAMGLALGEKVEERTDYAIKFYNVLSEMLYVPSTPTLFYSGAVRSQLSSCFLNTFEDSVFGIFDGLHQEAQKSKFAGGLGMDFTPFRAGGALINSTGGKTTGAVYTWKLFNDMLVSINQGGKRRGAGCGYLATWHYDIEDFLELKKNTGDERKRCHDLNTAHWIPDLFMKQVESEGKWYLFSPEEVPDLQETFGDEFEQKYWRYVEKGKAGELRLFREVNAKDLWKKMLKMLFETGHPWITFKDPSNSRYSNQHKGIVRSSNLCTEILLHTEPTSFKPNNDREIKEYGETAVCNLGSINTPKFIIVGSDGNKDINWPKLRDTTILAMRMLDNVIDINFYPTQEAKLSNTRHRPVGLGSMGWHDLYNALNIDYDSNEATALSRKLYEFISYNAILGSSELAKERGQYSSYEGSLWSQDIFPVDTFVTLMRKRDDSFNETRHTLETLNWDTVRDHVREYGMRNSNTMAIAPTASISTIVGCSPTTEPYFSNVFVYTTMSGDLTVINKWIVEDLRKYNAWDYKMSQQLKAADGDVFKLSLDFLPNQHDKDEFRRRHKTAFQVNQTNLLLQAQQRGMWIDMGMSVNLFNNTTSLKFLSDLYFKAWKLGLKTTYYLRNEGASEIEKASVVSEKVLSSIGDEKEDLGAAFCTLGEDCTSCQ